MADPRRHYVDRIRPDGAALGGALAAAFTAVPREAFVAGGFRRGDGGWATAADPDFRDLVYSDDVLVTKVSDGTPVSSSSQPSLMAIMLRALGVRPGVRVLEIGAGTGYNAALMSALGATVTSVDVQADVVARARAALRAAGVGGVRVRHGDGWAGAPGERFDRVIVTVGVTGLSPRWLDQLDGDGPLVVPVEHAGTHPVLVARGHTATVLCAAGFMGAAGPLAATHPGSHPAPLGAGVLTGFTPAAAARWDPPLSPVAYRDLAYAAGVHSRRATHAALRGQQRSVLVLLDDDRTGGAAVLPDGTVLTGGPQAGPRAAEAAGVLDRWEADGRPPATAWRVGLAPAGDPDVTIWTPASWTLT